MIVTKQQFKKGMEKQAFYKTELLYEAIGEAGFVLVDKQALSLSLRKEAALRKLLEDFPCCKGCKVFESVLKSCYGCPFRQIRIWFENLKREFEGLREVLGNGKT